MMTVQITEIFDEDESLKNNLMIHSPFLLWQHDYENFKSKIQSHNAKLEMLTLKILQLNLFKASTKTANIKTDKSKNVQKKEILDNNSNKNQLFITKKLLLISLRFYKIIQQLHEEKRNLQKLLDESYKFVTEQKQQLEKLKEENEHLRREEEFFKVAYEFFASKLDNITNEITFKSPTSAGDNNDFILQYWPSETSDIEKKENDQQFFADLISHRYNDMDYVNKITDLVKIYKETDKNENLKSALEKSIVNSAYQLKYADLDSLICESTFKLAENYLFTKSAGETMYPYNFENDKSVATIESTINDDENNLKVEQNDSEIIKDNMKNTVKNLNFPMWGQFAFIKSMQECINTIANSNIRAIIEMAHRSIDSSSDSSVSTLSAYTDTDSIRSNNLLVEDRKTIETINELPEENEIVIENLNNFQVEENGSVSDNVKNNDKATDPIVKRRANTSEKMIKKKTAIHKTPARYANPPTKYNYTRPKKVNVTTRDKQLNRSQRTKNIENSNINNQENLAVSFNENSLDKSENIDNISADIIDSDNNSMYTPETYSNQANIQNENYEIVENSLMKRESSDKYKNSLRILREIIKHCNTKCKTPSEYSQYINSSPINRFQIRDAPPIFNIVSKNDKKDSYRNRKNVKSKSNQYDGKKKNSNSSKKRSDIKTIYQQKDYVRSKEIEIHKNYFNAYKTEKYVYSEMPNKMSKMYQIVLGHNMSDGISFEFIAAKKTNAQMIINNPIAKYSTRNRRSLLRI